MFWKRKRVEPLFKNIKSYVPLVNNMALPKYRAPVPKADMEVPRVTFNSICQLLRDIYHLTENEEIQLKARIGVSMAKAMQGKINELKSIRDKWNAHEARLKKNA